VIWATPDILFPRRACGKFENHKGASIFTKDSNWAFPRTNTNQAAVVKQRIGGSKVLKTSSRGPFLGCVLDHPVAKCVSQTPLITYPIVNHNVAGSKAVRIGVYDYRYASLLPRTIGSNITENCASLVLNGLKSMEV
jgi:hypothetical protein